MSKQEMNEREAPSPEYHPSREDLEAFSRLLGIVRELRRECPWDREQTHESVADLLIEETFETVEAIENGDKDELKKELGDLALHVLFHCAIAEEAGSFNTSEVLNKESEKLVGRHPHVYGSERTSGTQEVLENWERIKIREGGPRSVLAGVPSSLPSLLRAQRIQQKVGGVGFEFPDGDGAWMKVEEELAEFKAADTAAQAAEEFGDLLFALVNYARFRDIHPESALRKTNNKFARRFAFVESELAKLNKTPDQSTLEEMDALWDLAKAEERNPSSK